MKPQTILSKIKEKINKILSNQLYTLGSNAYDEFLSGKENLVISQIHS